jgi:DNA-binding MltR family transcriptional regulator
MAKRVPLNPELLSADAQRFHELLNGAEDALVIVVGVAYIDACLASLLAKHFLEGSTSERLLDSRGGAVGAFATRASLAYVLGLVSKSLYRDLQTLAELRNEVAHTHFALDFSVPEVVAHCQALQYVGTLRNGSTTEPLIEEQMLSPPRNRFVLTAVMIANRLLLCALGATRVRPA